MARIDRINNIILELNGGLDIFRKELGEISFSKNIRVPWRIDKQPSLRLYKGKNGIIYYQDYGGNQSKGDCIDFLKEIYGISFQEALEKLKKDYIVGEKRVIDEDYYEEIETIYEPAGIDFIDCKFQQIHRNYWNNYLLPESYLNSKNVFAVKKWVLNKKVQKIPEDVAVFAYWAEDIDRVKIMQIGENIDKKWINNVPNTYLWNLPTEKVDELFLIKSYKDYLCMNYHFGKIGTAVQNESAITYLNNNVEKVERICSPENIIVLFGSDPQGVEQSKIIQKQRGYKYFNTPKYMYKYGVEDPADAIKEFGIESLKNQLIKKQLI